MGQKPRFAGGSWDCWCHWALKGVHWELVAMKVNWGHGSWPCTKVDWLLDPHWSWAFTSLFSHREGILLYTELPGLGEGYSYPSKCLFFCAWSMWNGCSALFCNPRCLWWYFLAQFFKWVFLGVGIEPLKFLCLIVLMLFPIFFHSTTYSLPYNSPIPLVSSNFYLWMTPRYVLSIAIWGS